MRPRSNQAKWFTLCRPSKGLRQVFKDAPVTQDLVHQALRISAKLGNDLVAIALLLLSMLNPSNSGQPLAASDARGPFFFSRRGTSDRGAD